VNGPQLNVELATALALIEACNRGDDKGVSALLADGDLRTVAHYLAWIAVDLLTDLAEWHRGEMPAMLARQRESWLADV
jgi:hypothetical protein